MKKRNDEELDELIEDEIIDDEETLDEELDDEIIDDEVSEDEIVEDEIEEAPKSKGKKEKNAKKDKKGKDGKKKKKLSKGAIAGIVVGSVAVVVALVFVTIAYILPLFAKDPVVATEFDKLLAVNGYQNYEATQAASQDPTMLRTGATYDHIVTVQEMLAATGDDAVNQEDDAEFAAALYSLAITNYANIKGTGWYCYTNSSVYANKVEALSLPFEKFEVGIRAAYGIGSLEADAPNAAQADRDNYWSQTISGVTKLDIAGIPSWATDMIMQRAGYNSQEMLYNGKFYLRRGKNGGAEFYGNDDAIGYKYFMGACYPKFVENYKKNDKKEDGYPAGTYLADTYSDAYAESKSLDGMGHDDNIYSGATTAWGALDIINEFSFEISPYGNTKRYYCGNYGVGWATYNFSKEYIDSSTTVTYDSATHIYTINMKIKEGMDDEACKFAKGSLTKDTKDYIQMQNPKYELKENIIQIYDNGLIKSWDRVETVSSTQKAQLTLLDGDCNGGGGTTNETHMAFSYAAIDFHPLALAARYMSEIGTTTHKFPSKYVLDLSKWPSFSNYDPQNKTAEYLALKA